MLITGKQHKIMDKRKYVFVGNREYVLRKMIEMGLDIKAVYVMENSFLHHRLEKLHFIDYSVVSKKKHFLELLSSVDYDVLVSNGCKYILPIKDMKEALYINIHPSHLPDLKGMDPINGACLFNRTAGAACHIIDAGIDTGKIISRVSVLMTDDIDATLLFQLSFKAEVMAFEEAYNRNFRALEQQPIIENALYYTISPADMLIDFSKDFESLVNQSKAFGYKSKGLYFKCDGIVYKCFKVSRVLNPFVINLSQERKENEVFISFDNSVLIKHKDGVLRIDGIVDEGRTIQEGQVLENCEIEDIQL